MQHLVADPERQDLLDAVVLDVVHLGLDRRAGLEPDVLGPDAEDEAPAPGARPARAERQLEGPGVTTALPPASIPSSRLIGGEPTKLATKVSRGLL